MRMSALAIPRVEDHRMVPGRWATSGGFPQRFSTLLPFFLPSAAPVFTRLRDIVSGILRCSCSFCFFDDGAEDSLGCACLYSNLVAPFLGNPLEMMPALLFSLTSFKHSKMLLKHEGRPSSHDLRQLEWRSRRGLAAIVYLVEVALRHSLAFCFEGAVSTSMV